MQNRKKLEIKTKNTARQCRRGRFPSDFITLEKAHTEEWEREATVCCAARGKKFQSAALYLEEDNYRHHTYGWRFSFTFLP